MRARQLPPVAAGCAAGAWLITGGGTALATRVGGAADLAPFLTAVADDHGWPISDFAAVGVADSAVGWRAGAGSGTDEPPNKLARKPPADDGFAGAGSWVKAAAAAGACCGADDIDPVARAAGARALAMVAVLTGAGAALPLPPD